MLSLKSRRLAPYANEPRTSITQLPVEILDIIAAYLFHDSLDQIDSLTSFASVSHRFRQSALPILFHRVSYALRDGLDQSPSGSLRHLIGKPHLICHVQILVISTPFDRHDLDRGTTTSLTQGDHSQGLEKLQRSLQEMPVLRQIRFESSADMVFNILEILPRDRGFEIILDRIYPSLRRPTTIAVAGEIEALARNHKIALGIFGQPPPRDPMAVQAVQRVISGASSIDLHVAWLFPQHQIQQEAALTSPRDVLSSGPVYTWEELRLRIKSIDQMRTPSMAEMHAAVQWESLRRLSIDWGVGVPVNHFMQDIVPRLIKLQALRLRAAHFQSIPPEIRGRPSPRVPTFMPDKREFDVNFHGLKELRELEIDGKCSHVPITSLVSPGLRHLRIHCESALQWSFNPRYQRPPADIIEAARRAPDLERLELDIGYIDNLWHPTAIPGVDVDVEQYSFLDAIAKFRRLRFLRLFPPFVPRGEQRSYQDAALCVPVSDDQAIRLFEHLRKKCPSLQMLSIAAIPPVVEVDTMCWEVRREGEKTILTTKHRDRNYQHRQIWIGQRRINSEIQRFTTVKKYLTESDSWVLPRNDMERNPTFL